MIFGLFKKKEDRATLATPTTWLYNSLTGGSTASGINVNPTTALNCSAVFAAVRLLSESVASLPLHTYERLPDGKQRTRVHPVSKLLATTPNPQQSSYSFRETLMGHVLTYGNAYAEIVRDGSGMPTALLPVTPDRVRVTIDESGAISYIVDEQITLDQDSMFHIAGLGFDGLIGYSPITLSRGSIGLAIAAEQFGASFFSNGARLGGVLEHPGKLSIEAADRLRESWGAAHSGSSKAGSTALLEEGLKWQQLGLSQEDAQYLQTRQFQVTEIARWYGIPPHLIADLDRSTYSNIEHQSIEFVTHSLRPWLVRWEQEIQRKLFPDDTHFPEFVVDGLLRGDTRTRYESYRIARETGWMSVNEIRSLENLNPVEGGDQYIQPLNMGTVAEQPATDRSWAIPLLAEALMRAKRVQENKERQALRRKGDYYGEWRTAWRAEELPAIVTEIIYPTIETVCRSSDMCNRDIDIAVTETALDWINSNSTEEQFAAKVVGSIK